MISYLSTNAISHTLLLSLILLSISACKDVTQQSETSLLKFQSQVAKSTENKVLYKKGSALFTQANIDDLVEFAEFLARSPLTKKDKKVLIPWAINDFISAPEKSAEFYRVLSGKLIKDIRKQPNKKNFRTRLFISFVTSFKHQKRPNNHILTIIDHYNPPIKEALQLRAIEHNLIMQQSQRNQTQFKHAFKSSQAITEQIKESLNRQAERTAITLPSRTIIKEGENSYKVEDETGDRYDVYR